MRFLLVNGRVDEAIRELQAAFELMPNDWDTVEPMVDAMQRTGRADEARQLLQAKLDANPELIGVRAALAGLLAGTGAKSEALALLESGLAVDPRQPDLSNALAQILIDPVYGEPSRVNEAVARMERVCAEMKRAHPEATYELAISLHPEHGLHAPGQAGAGHHGGTAGAGCGA